MFVGFPPRQAYRGERIFVDEITTVQRFFFFQTSAHNSDSRCGHGSQIRSVLFSCCCVVLEGVLPCFLCFLKEALAGFLCFSCRVPCLCLGFSLQLKLTSKNTWNTFHRIKKPTTTSKLEDQNTNRATSRPLIPLLVGSAVTFATTPPNSCSLCIRERSLVFSRSSHSFELAFPISSVTTLFIQQGKGLLQVILLILDPVPGTLACVFERTLASSAICAGTNTACELIGPLLFLSTPFFVTNGFFADLLVI